MVRVVAADGKYNEEDAELVCGIAGDDLKSGRTANGVYKEVMAL